MDTNRIRKITATATVVAICISGTWAAAPPAQATTDCSGGAASASTVVEIDQIVAMRKMRMARDYVTYAAARTKDATGAP